MHVDSPEADSIGILDVCAGSGMLGEGVHTAIPGSRVVGFVERQAHSAAVLLERMESQTLSPAPIWCGDLREFDCAAYRAIVHCVVAGFPCQPWSLAGSRKGVDDERWILPDILDMAVELEAPLIALENNRGLDVAEVISQLDQRGYVVAWAGLEAADVGASHHRFRWFFLAYSDCYGRKSERVRRVLDGIRQTQRDHVDGCGGANRADASGLRRSEANSRQPEAGDREGADAEGQRRAAGRVRQRDGAAQSDAQGTGSNRLFAYGPQDSRSWRQAPETQPAVGGLVHGLAEVVDLTHRKQQLWLIGNGVVPLQAAVAYRVLAYRLADHLERHEGGTRAGSDDAIGLTKPAARP